MANIPGFRAIIPTRSKTGVPNIVYTGKAGSNIGGHRVIKKDSSSLVQYASSVLLSDLGKVIGLSTTAASTGELVNILLEGEIEEPSWNWTLDTPIYLADNGLMMQTVPVYPTYKFSQIVAFPITATRILWRLREPVILSS